MKGPLTDQVRIQHILDAISEVEDYLQDVSLVEFLTNSEKRFATIKQIEIIGEACNRISTDFKDIHPEIEWRSIIGFRNISIHEYFGVNFQIVWEIAKYDLPILKQHFSKSLQSNASINKITLYRPVGLQELLLISASDFKHFPPRLSWQPIFYPVLNQPYAEQIAYEWNTKDKASGYCGIVTRFAISNALFQKYEIQNVGGEIHNELWVPADELDTFNRDIQGKIEIVKAFLGEEYIAPEDPILAKAIADLV